MAAEQGGRARVSTSIAVVAAALAVEALIVAGWATGNDGTASIRIAGSVVTGLLFVACGVVARHRTAYPRMGSVLVLAGFLWMSEDLAVIGYDLADSLQALTTEMSNVAVALAALAFPTGRFRGRADRGVLIVLLVGIGLGILGEVAKPGECSLGCVTGYEPTIQLSTADLIADIGTAAMSAALLAGLAILIVRWRSGTRPARRMLTPFLGVVGVLGVINSPVLVGMRGVPFADLQPLSYALIPLAFLAGMLRVRLTRVSLTGVARELRQPASLAEVSSVLRRRLGDDRIAVCALDGDTWRDEQGAEVAPPAAHGATAVTEITRTDGSVLGVLVHDPSIAEDTELIEALGGILRMTLENESLQGEVTAQLARTADAADGERRRVARDLHDGAQQSLVGLMLDVSALRNRLAAESSPDIQALLSSIEAGAGRSLDELRRLVNDIAPPTLADDGLGPAVEELVRTIPVPVVLEDRLNGRLPAPLESAAYLIVSESLANIVKHAEAHVARVRLSSDGGVLELAISDDGRGGADRARGSGIRGLDDRARALGGSLTLTSPPGRGTTVAVELPLGGRSRQAEEQGQWER